MAADYSTSVLLHFAAIPSRFIARHHRHRIPRATARRRDLAIGQFFRNLAMGDLPHCLQDRLQFGIWPVGIWADSGGRVFAGQVTIGTFAGGRDDFSSSKLQGKVLNLKVLAGNGTEAKSTKELEHRCVFREDLRD